MPSRLDILGLGCVSIDDLLFVAAYPPADSKTQVRRTPGIALRPGHHLG